MNQPLSSKANRGAPAVFFAIFGLFGLVFLYFTFPIFKIIGARTWNSTPCVITRSAVGTHSGKNGPTYSVDIAYSYAVGGQFYTGKRYQFMAGSSSGRTGKAAIVARYPPGTHAFCFVNPRDPVDAVIERGFTPDMWFSLIPGLFAVIGVWGFVYSRRAAKRGINDPGLLWKPAALRHAADFSAVSPAPRELKPSATPMGKLVFLCIFALFWNGIISIMLRQVLNGWQHGRADWVLTLFSVPFAAVGIGVVIAVFYQALALFNPRVHLRVDPGAVALGDALAIAWTIEGRAGRLTSLRISLEGQEEATYQNGKNTSTATNVFSSVELVNTTSQADFASGTARATLPRDSMHSLDTGHNKITWKIKIQGGIPRWPDVKEDYPLAVLPLRKEAGQ